MAKNLGLDEFKKTTKAQVKHNKYTSYIEEEIDKLNFTDKDKRINMGFSDDNYNLIISEADELGIPLFVYVNAIISLTDNEKINKYIDAQIIKTSKAYIPRRKGNKLNRINLKFSKPIYDEISNGAKIHNQTISQYVNTIIKVHKQEENNINTI